MSLVCYITNHNINKLNPFQMNFTLSFTYPNNNSYVYAKNPYKLEKYCNRDSNVKISQKNYNSLKNK